MQPWQEDLILADHPESMHLQSSYGNEDFRQAMPCWDLFQSLASNVGTNGGEAVPDDIILSLNQAGLIGSLLVIDTLQPCLQEWKPASGCKLPLRVAVR